MMKYMPQPVAKANGRIVGYALATSLEASLENKLLKPLAELCETLEIENARLCEQRYYIMGQICVSEGWRGTGVFDALYQKHRELFANSYDCVVTEISQSNFRSLVAHLRTGFQTIHQYSDAETDWNIVQWAWKTRSRDLSS